jgi:hypothetical protein
MHALTRRPRIKPPVASAAPTHPLRRGRRIASLSGVPLHWFWMQVLIVVFVLAGMVIAITKLA